MNTAQPVLLCQGPMPARIVQRQWGQQGQGVPLGGPLDRCSALTCNRLLQQDDDTALLEWDQGPLQLRCIRACQVAVGGAPRRLRLDGEVVLRYRTLSLSPGALLHLGPAQGGSLGYVALRGGLSGDVAASKSSSEEKPLFCINDLPPLVTHHKRLPWQAWAASWAPPAGVLRCLPGPDWGEDLRPLLSGPYSVSRARDRRGMRLQAAQPMPERPYDIVSNPTVEGLVQLTPGGPILLLADRGTVGGYLRAWIVIPSDRDLAAQMPVGSQLSFQLIDYSQALAIAHMQQKMLSSALI